MCKRRENTETNKSNEIDCGKIGLSLIGAFVCAPYLFPSLGVLTTASTVAVISKGLITVGTTALSAITAYGVIELTRKTKEDELKNELLINARSNDARIKQVLKEEKENDKVKEPTVQEHKVEENKYSKYKNNEKEGGVIIC